MNRVPVAPPRWTAEQLDAASRASVEAFVTGWAESKRYRVEFEKLRPAVVDLLEATDDLRGDLAVALAASRDALRCARFLTGPPVSEDDLKTLAESRLPARLPADEAARIAAVLTRLLDPFRYPWLAESRPATPAERRAATAWTTSLLAVEAARTGRRGTSSKRQEQAVADALARAGFTETKLTSPIRELESLAKGNFARETVIAGAKCDLPVRLLDGRLLAIECKVSNSSINSVKRLNRETCGKAKQWAEEFGKQVITAVVLAGVFRLANLIEAQDQHHVAIFWEHDPGSLEEFVGAAR